MKAKNSLMGMLCPINKLLNRKYILAFLLVFMCIWGQSSVAQTPILTKLNIPEGGLKIGDKVPEEVWNLPLQVVNHPDGKEVITLNDYRGKLIILDFWATWCSSCVIYMPNILDLKSRFDDDINILLVTHEDKRLTKDFLSSNATMKPLGLSSIVDGKVLRDIFPHKSIPHYVWIDNEGMVQAVTASHQVTYSNIERSLKDNKSELIAKNEFDLNRPLLMSELLDNELSHYSILVKGYHSGFSARSFERRKDEVLYGKGATNVPLLTIYKSLAQGLFKKMGKVYSDRFMLVDLKEKDQLVFNISDIKQEKKKLYSYDVVLPISKADNLYSSMLQMLNSSLDYEATIEHVSQTCLVLKRIGKIDRIRTSEKSKHSAIDFLGDIELINCPMTTLVSVLSNEKWTDRIVVDETAYDHHIDIKLHVSNDLLSLQDQLLEYGLELVETELSLPFFVVRDK